MGMFDSVIAECPSCGEEIEFQSKAGDCGLKRYHFSNVPPEVAADVDEDSRNCSCGEVLTLRLPLASKRVGMTLDRITGESWD